MTISDLTKQLSIQASPSGRHLVTAATGDPFFWRADTAWSLFHRLTNDEVIHYLDVRKEQGFNVVMAVVLNEWDGPHTPNQEGEYIFEADFAGNRQDVTRCNERYFQHIDWVVEQAAHRGITVALVPNWGKYVNGGWMGGGADTILFNEQNAPIFGHYIGNRYPGLPKLLGGDTNRFWLDASSLWAAMRRGEIADISQMEITDTGPVFDAMGTAILKAEASHGIKAFQTFHPTAMWLASYPEARAAAYFADAAWLNMDAAQSGHATHRTINTEPGLKWWMSTEPYVAVEIMWRDAAMNDCRSQHKTGKRAIIDLEGHYEGMRDGLLGDNPRFYNENDIRNGTYSSVLSGACGYVYGANSVWQMYEPDRGLKPACGLDPEQSWKKDLQFTGANQLRHMNAIFASLSADALDRRIPDQSILVDGPRKGESRISIMRDDYMPGKPSTFILAYSGTGQPFTLDLRCLGVQQAQAQWHCPRTGGSESIGDVAGDKQTFIPPSSGSTGHDWLLVVRSHMM